MPYVPPKYPAEIPDTTDLPDYTDDVSWVTAKVFNDLKKELRAALIELGVLPKGAYATVRARLDAIEAAAAGVPAGCILLWSGLVANIPSGWSLCDGGGGRPDLREKFVKGAAAAVNPGGTGGNKTHLHAVLDHTHTVNGVTGVNNTAEYMTQDPGEMDVARHTHTHSMNFASGGATPNTDSKNHEPEYYEVAYIIKD